MTAASLYKPAGDKMPVAPGIKRVWLSEKRPDSLLQRLKSLFSQKSFCELEFAYPDACDWVSRCIDDAKPDLIIFNHIRVAWLAPSVNRDTIPAIYLAHNAESLAYASIAKLEGNPAGKAFAWLESRKLRCLESRILKSVSHVICLTEEDAQQLLAIQPGIDIEIVPPCHRFNACFSRPLEKLSIVLVIGSFHWRPKRTNILWFLREVYMPLRRVRPDLRCLVVGANASSLQTLIPQNLGIELKANVPEVEPFLRLPAIFVTPERQRGGIKLKTCEAALYGLPIVSTSPGMEGTGLRDQESCLVANSPEELQAALVRCLDDPVFAAALGRKARQIAAVRFSAAEVGSRLRHVVNRALSAAESPRR